jgi:hypothetical protein
MSGEVDTVARIGSTPRGRLHDGGPPPARRRLATGDVLGGRSLFSDASGVAVDAPPPAGGELGVKFPEPDDDLDRVRVDPVFPE